MDVSDPDSRRRPECVRVPGLRADLEDAFEKNIPFALDVADSADDPANPESHLGRETPDFQIQPFDVSYGDPQTVEINAKRELGPLTVHWKVNGGATQTASTSEYAGGERYGENQNVYYHYVRGTVTGTAPGDQSASGSRAAARPRRRSPTRSAPTRGDDVLVVAAEDYTGDEQQPGLPERRPARSSTTTTPTRWRRTASTPTSTTSTPRAAGRRIRSACSATTTRSSGTRATTC